MKNRQNLDGIKNSKYTTHTKGVLGPRLKVVMVDSVVKTAAKPKQLLSIKPARLGVFSPNFFKKLKAGKRVPVLASVIALLLAFGGGAWAALSTNQSVADSQPQVLGASTSVPAQAITVEPSKPLGQLDSLPDNVMFNMTISQLENYLNQQAENERKTKQAQTLLERGRLLKAYLQEKKSPLANIVDTLAGLKHWKMVLAISNSESSLGKYCAGGDNNCSGIGVAPGNPLWRTYPSKAEWAKDLDKLLEKRYKDWTLEQMNGVYDYPGSDNWLMASKQILEDLQARGIE